VVKLTGDQSIEGEKTFDTDIVVPSASALIDDESDTTHYATKAEVYVTAEALAASIINDEFSDSGLTWSSEKLSGDFVLKADDDAVVKLAGDQSIEGEKTFDTDIVVPEADGILSDDSDKTHYATRAEVYNTTDDAVKNAIEAALLDLTPRAELASVVTGLSAEQSDTEVKLIADSYNAVTQQSTSSDIPIPSATQAAHGAMTPAQVTALTQAVSDIEGLKQTGGKFVGTFATKAALDAYEVPERIKANDFVYVMDDETHDNAISKYVYDGAEFLFALVVEYDPTGIATTTDAGLVLSGAGVAGSIDVDVDGKMSVHGWDSVVKLTGDQVVAGAKTFSALPAVPAASAAITDDTDDTHPATKAEVFNSVSNAQVPLATLDTVALGSQTENLVKSYTIENDEGVLSKWEYDRGNTTLSSNGAVTLQANNDVVTVVGTQLKIPTASAALESGASTSIASTRAEVYNTVASVLSSAINDSATTTSNVWSASKVNAQLTALEEALATLQSTVDSFSITGTAPITVSDI
jgi:hypothetical protein